MKKKKKEAEMKRRIVERWMRIRRFQLRWCNHVTAMINTRDVFHSFLSSHIIYEWRKLQMVGTHILMAKRFFCHLASEYTRIHTDRISRAEMIQHATFSERRWEWWFYQNQLSSNKQPKLHTTCPCENCIWNGSLEKSPSFVVCISIKGSLVFMEMCYIYAYIRRNKYTHTLMPTLFDWSILFVQIGWISVATHISNYGYKKKAPKNTHTHALTMK